MPATLALDEAWDITLDENGNLAVLSEAQGALAQDAASAIKTFLGEYYLDTSIGVPWLQQILGKRANLALVRQQLVQVALTVPDVAAAQVFFSSFSQRAIDGQVQVASASTGIVTAAPFAVTNPQGLG